MRCEETGHYYCRYKKGKKDGPSIVTDLIEGPLNEFNRSIELTKKTKEERTAIIMRNAVIIDDESDDGCSPEELDEPRRDNPIVFGRRIGNPPPKSRAVAPEPGGGYRGGLQNQFFSNEYGEQGLPLLRRKNRIREVEDLS